MSNNENKKKMKFCKTSKVQYVEIGQFVLKKIGANI